MIPTTRTRIYEHASGLRIDPRTREVVRAFDPQTTYRVPAHPAERKLIESALCARYDRDPAGWFGHANALGCRSFRLWEEPPDQEELEGLVVVRDPYGMRERWALGSAEVWIGIPDDLALKILLLGEMP